jgi:phage regulator Rha-like protein
MSNLTILQNQSVLTMSSREIADITSKLHKNVTQLILKLYADELLTAEPQPSTFEHKGNKYTCYFLNKRDSIFLVARLSPEFTAKLVDRWQELEQKQSAPQFNIPQTLPEALRLAADLADQLEQAKPKLAVYDLLADRKGDVSTTIVAKEIGTTAFKLNKFLRDNGIKWLNADLPKAGYETWFNCIADVKNGHEFTQCLVTPKGQIEIAKLWSKA